MVHMRPHVLLAAASLLGYATASADADVTVVTTITNTHTVCPLTSLLPSRCGPAPTSPPEGHNEEQPNDAEMSNIYNSWISEHETVSLISKVSHTWEDWTQSSKPTGSYNGSVTTSFGGSPTASYNGTSTKSSTTSPTATLSSNLSVTKPFEGKSDTGCNTESNRGRWCDGKSIDTDYYKEYKTGKTCKADLTITNTTLAYDKAPVMSFAINGQSPGPVIECNWGDMIEITVHNRLENNATTIHWHGIRQVGTNDMDGVPGISECALVPGQSKTYRFLASSYGTGWYHSHLLAQYGDGIRGPIVIHGPATANYDIDMGTVMVHDAFSVSAFQQAYRVAHFGTSPSTNYLLNGANRATDNASGKHALFKIKPGKKHLFRFINAAVQDVYTLHFDNHKMKVIAADFVPIVPYETEWLNIACGQRYDVIIEADQPVATYFLRAATQTACPSICVNTGLGISNGILQYEGAPLVLPTSDFGNRTAASFATCADEPLAKLVPHLKKTAGDSAKFQASQKAMPAGGFAQTQVSPDHRIFQWFINNALIEINYTQPTLLTLADDPTYFGSRDNTNQTALVSNAAVLRQKNEWVYFVVANQFFPSHPMHLHGHDMSILGSGVGAFSDVSTLNFDNPLRRDTVMLRGGRPGSPLGYTVIGFETDNPGAWLMHCHIVWHVEGGLAMQFVERPDEIDAKKYVGKKAYGEECAAMGEWVKDPHHQKEPGQAGLKRDFEYGDVVRRDAHLKRHLKHGHF